MLKTNLLLQKKCFRHFTPNDKPKFSPRHIKEQAICLFENTTTQNA